MRATKTLLFLVASCLGGFANAAHEAKPEEAKPEGASSFIGGSNLTVSPPIQIFRAPDQNGGAANLTKEQRMAMVKTRQQMKYDRFGNMISFCSQSESGGDPVTGQISLYELEICINEKSDNHTMKNDTLSTLKENWKLLDKDVDGNLSAKELAHGAVNWTNINMLPDILMAK